MTRRVALAAAAVTGLGGLAAAVPAIASPSYSVVCSTAQVDAPRGQTTLFSLHCEDTEGGPVDSYVVLSSPTKAAAFTVDAATGEVSYRSTPEATGTDSFTFKGVVDGLGESAVTTATITLANNRPTCSPVEGLSVVHDRQAEVTLDCSDADGDQLTVVSGMTGAGHGAVDIVDGVVTYTPASGYVGPDTFSLRATDGSLYSDDVAVAVDVTNQAPVCTGSTVTAWHSRSKQITLRCSDPDGDAITRSVSVVPQHGTVTVSGVLATYRPVSRYLGTDRFRVVATDGIATSTSAAYTVNVTNAAPRCTAVRSLRVRAGRAVAFRVRCTDANGDAVRLAAAQRPRFGKLLISGNRVTYFAKRGVRGRETVRIVGRDGVSSSRPTATTVSVTR